MAAEVDGVFVRMPSTYRSLTRTAAREWAPTGVTINAVCPAAKSQAFFRAIADYPELEAMADAANPMGRMGDPYHDIAPVVVLRARAN